jgi:hypothetical protein
MTENTIRAQFTSKNRFAGEKLPAKTKLVTRASKWGNPFKVLEATPAGHQVAVDLHAAWLREHPEDVAAIRAELAGWNLACACPLDWPCHADTLLRIAAGGEP